MAAKKHGDVIVVIIKHNLYSIVLFIHSHCKGICADQMTDIIIIIIKGIYIVQVGKGHKCTMWQRWQCGYGISPNIQTGPSAALTDVIERCARMTSG